MDAKAGEAVKQFDERVATYDIKNLINGPGNLTKALDINKNKNGLDLTGDELYIEDSERVEVAESARIGLSKGKGKLLRFYVKGNRLVSKSKQQKHR